jgi:two-component system, LuxR family, response regulator FixJ
MGMQTMTVRQAIYVVDDDEAVRDSLCALLESYGYAADGFASVDAFVDAYRPGVPGCVVLDLHMPKSGGLKLLQNAGLLGIDLPVIVVTGSLDAWTEGLLREAGAVAVLEKPFEDLSLIGVIRSVMVAPASTGTPTEL